MTSILLLGTVLAAGDTDLAALASRLPVTETASVYRAARDELRQAGQRETQAWKRLQSRRDWETYLQVRLQRLETSLGTFPAPPRDLKVRVRKTLEGNGVRLDCLTFESRPGVVVTANLYRPAQSAKSMPGFLLVHSHHNPKTQEELQDMGVLWARAGCLVLVMDLLGHGERRQHPYSKKEDYSESFRPGRQDYYFRYNVALQLQTLGDSLMGWLCWDLRRGVDLLLAQPGIDRERIAILGAVAGGGDPAAVTAALDRRIAASAIFNFGGPQPETVYPLPADAEDRFLYTGSGSWESTRNLARSARDGFLPWVITASIAPRRHVYGHEFAWDPAPDPVWKRLQQVHTWFGGTESLSVSKGKGRLSGKPPESSHCNNIGPIHRQGIHSAFASWFHLKPPDESHRERRSTSDLLCLGKGETLEPIHRLLERLGNERIQAARQQRAKLSATQQRRVLREDWARLLGHVEPSVPVRVVYQDLPTVGDVRGQVLTLLGRTPSWALLLQGRDHRGRMPAIVAFGQGGPAGFLKERGKEIRAHLRQGRAVVLASLGGLSDEAPGTRGRTSGASSLASTYLMLGEPALGQRLCELRTLLAHLRLRPDLDPTRVSVWGDSFALANSEKVRLERPLDVPQPAQAEPLGGILALLCGLFEEELESIDARGGLAGYQSLLASQFVHIPHDVLIPGALTTGDLVDVTANLAPIRVRLVGLVDGLNRRVPLNTARDAYRSAFDAYRSREAGSRLTIE